MRIVFMGTPEFAVRSLEKLHERGMEIAGVVTQPDKPRGRNGIIMPPPVKRFALDKGYSVLQPRRAEHITEEMKALAPDFIVVVAFGQILKHETLSIPRKACINLHASLLPRYRGASPIHFAILNGEKETGVTTMLLDEGMDTGAILLQERATIEKDDTTSTLSDKLAIVGAELLARTLEDFDNIIPTPQDCSCATRTTLLTREHGGIDWSRTAPEICNLVRSCDSGPCAFTHLDGKRIIIWNCASAADEPPAGAIPGTIISIEKDRGIIVAAGEGAVAITELQREGKKRQGHDEFVHGARLKPGDRFTGVTAGIQEDQNEM